MKVRMNTVMAGPEGTAQPGDVLDLPPKKAKELIGGGFATKVVAVERATAEPAGETADGAPQSEQRDDAFDTKAEDDAVAGGGDQG